jgi:bifunctional DNA-binding transcriptional regulator/antitoxin component of YhaV-PrlF toxin-antitoxin module
MAIYEEKKSKLGKKGEIYTDKRIRELVGLKPEDEIYILAKPGVLIVKKIPSIDEILSKEPLASISIEEFERISESMQKEVIDK